MLQLQLVIDPQYLQLGLGLAAAHHPSLGNGQGQNVRQVVFALGVVIANPWQVLEQVPRRGRQHTRVDFADVALGITGIAMFDHRYQRAGFIPQNASVTCRVRDRGGQQRRPTVGHGHQGLQGSTPDERDIAVEHQHGTLGRDGGHGLQHAVAGAQLLLLYNPVDLITRQGLRHRIRAVAYHHMHRQGLKLQCSADDMFQQGPAGKRMQHLGQGGLHPLTLARGKNNHFQLHSTFTK